MMRLTALRGVEGTLPNGRGSESGRGPRRLRGFLPLVRRSPALAALWFVFAAAAVLGQDTAPIQKAEQFLAGAAGDYDWDREYQSVERAVNTVWERNHWDSESHRYARDAFLAVVRIPPWQVSQRFDRFNNLLTDRYHLSSRQQTELRGAMLGEAGLVLGRHSGLVFGIAKEMLTARLEGKPITAEQVARWTRDSEPLVADLNAAGQRMTDNLRAGMTTSQREVFDRDVQALHERGRALGAMRERWRKGEWDPEQWGLGDDPIQKGETTAKRSDALDAEIKPVGAAPPNNSPQAPTPGHPQPTTVTVVLKWDPTDPETWPAYVLAQKAKYNFDDGQSTTADSIRRELVGRAAEYLAANREAATAVPPARRDLDPVFEPVRRWFSELQARVEAIPTASQRQAD